MLKQTARVLETSLEETEQAARKLIEKNEAIQKLLAGLKKDSAKQAYESAKAQVRTIKEMQVMTLIVEGSNADALRELADLFRQDFPNGMAVFANVAEDGSVQLVATASDALVKKGAHAGNLAKAIAGEIGGSGGGRPQLAQAGGKDAGKLNEIFGNIERYL